MPAEQCNLKVRKNERLSVNNRGVSCGRTQIACQGTYTRRALRTSRTEINPVCGQTDAVTQFTSNANSAIRMKRGYNTASSDSPITKKRNKVVRQHVGVSQTSLNVNPVSNARNTSTRSISAKSGRSSEPNATHHPPVIKRNTRLSQRSLRASAQLHANLPDSDRRTVPNESDGARKPTQSCTLSANSAATVGGATSDLLRHPGKPNLSSALCYWSISAHDTNSLAGNAGNRGKRTRSGDNSANARALAASQAAHHGHTVTNNGAGVESGLLAAVVISSAESVKRYPRNRSKGGSPCSSTHSDSPGASCVVISPCREPVPEKLRVKWRTHRQKRTKRPLSTDTEGNAVEQVAAVPKKIARCKRAKAVSQQDKCARTPVQPLPDSDEAAVLAAYATIYKCNLNARVVLERLAPPAHEHRSTGESEDSCFKGSDSSAASADMSPVYIKMRSNDEVLVDMTNYHTDGSIKFDISSPSSGCYTYSGSPPNEAGIIVRRIETDGFVESDDDLMRVRPSGIPYTPGGSSGTPDVEHSGGQQVVASPVTSLHCSIEHVKLNCTVSPITPKPGETNAANKYRIGFNNSATRYVPHWTSVKPSNKPETVVVHNGNDRVQAPEPVHVEVPAKLPVAIQCAGPRVESQVVSSHRDDGIAAEKDSVKSAEPTDGSGLDSVPPEKEAQGHRNKRDGQSGRKIRLKRNTATECAAPADKPTPSAVSPHTDSCQKPSPDRVQAATSEGGGQSRSETDVSGMQQLVQLRQPITFAPTKPLSEQETKCLLANIKSFELPRFERGKQTAACERQGAVEGITRIVRRKAANQTAKANETVLVCRTPKVPETVTPKKDINAPRLAAAISGKTKQATVPDKKVAGTLLSGVREPLPSASPAAVGTSFAMPAVPARKRRRIVYDESLAASPAATVPDARNECVKLTEPECPRVPDRSKDVPEAALEVATKKTDVESSCSSEGSEDKEMHGFASDEYCSRNKHSFKFTDKGNLTPGVHAKRKIKLKRPVIFAVPAGTGTGPQTATEPKVTMDCDIISIYADTIANDTDERPLDADPAAGDTEFDKSLTDFNAKPADFINEWLRASVVAPITGASEPPEGPAVVEHVSPLAVGPRRPSTTGNDDAPVEQELPAKQQQPTTIISTIRPPEPVALRQPPAALPPRPPNDNIFKYMCVNVKRVGMCRKVPKCRYQHTFPIGWESTVQSMSKESLLHLYNSVKRTKSEFVFKKIFATVAKQLGAQRDFISVVGLVKDVLELNIHSDRTPFIKYIIEALGNIGLTFQSTVEVIFSSTCVDPHLKDLLTDILITITVEHGHFERNWSAMQVLVKHRNFEVDNGIIQATLMECVKEGTLQKELCLKVYNDLLSHVSDDKLRTIFASLLRDYIECMRKLGLASEAGALYDRCTTLSLLPSSSTPSSCSNKSIQSMKSVSDVSPLRPSCLVGDHLGAPNTTCSPLNAAKMAGLLANHTVPAGARVPTRKPVVNKVPPWSNAHSNLFLKEATVVKRSASPSSSAYVAPYVEKWPEVESGEVKRAIYAADVSKLLTLIVQHKDGPFRDRFLASCVETMHESVQKFSRLFSNMCRSVAIIQRAHSPGRDAALTYVFTTLGTNLFVYCTQQDKWEQAHTVYRALCNLYKDTDMLNVKMLIDDKPSYIKRSLILCRICIKACDFKHAWWLFKEHRLLLTSSWDKDHCEQDVEYKDTVFTELLALVSKSKQWPLAFGVVEYVLTHNLTELYAQLNNLILVAIKNECHVDYIVSLTNVCPVWYQRVHRRTFRIILIKVMKCGMQRLTRDLYHTGCEMNIYQSFFGNERSVEIGTHFMFEEIQLMLNILLTKMLDYMPITYPVVLTAKQSFDLDDDTCGEVPTLLYQNKIGCETLRVRIVNILNNYIKPPIMVLNRKNQLIISPEQLHKHLTVRRATNELY